MYRNIVQWRQIRHKILEQGVSQREMSRKTGMSRNTISKIANNELPPERAKRIFPNPKNDIFSKEIIATVQKLIKENNGNRITVKLVFNCLRSEFGYPYSYSGLREYIIRNSIGLGLDAAVNRRNRMLPRTSDWRLTHSVLAGCGPASGVAYLKTIARAPAQDIQTDRMQKYASILRKEADDKVSRPSVKTAQDAANNWVSFLVMSGAPTNEIASRFDDSSNIEQLVEIARSQKSEQAPQSAGSFAVTPGCIWTCCEQICGYLSDYLQEIYSIICEWWFGKPVRPKALPPAEVRQGRPKKNLIHPAARTTCEPWFQ